MNKRLGRRNTIFAVIVALGVLALYGGLVLINIHTPVVVCHAGQAEVLGSEKAMRLIAGEWQCEPDMLSPEQMRHASGQTKNIMHMGNMEGYTYAILLTGENLKDLYVMLPRSRGSRLFINNQEAISPNEGISSQYIFYLGDYLHAKQAEIVLQVPVSGYFYSGYQGIALGGYEELNQINEIRYIVEIMCQGVYLALVLMCMTLFLQKTSERYILLLIIFVIVTAYRFITYSKYFSKYLISPGLPGVFRLFFFLRYVLCRVFISAARRRLGDKLMGVLTLISMITFVALPHHFLTIADKLNLAAMVLEGLLIITGLYTGQKGSRILFTGWAIYTGMEIFYRSLHGGIIPQGIVDVIIKPTQYAHMVYLLAFSATIFGKFASKFKEAEAMTALLEQKVQEQTKELREKSEHIIRVQQNRQQFLTDIVHNIRSGLFSLGGYFELMEDELSQPTPQQQTYLTAINGKLSYINRMVSDMLLIDRLENDKISFHFVNIDLIIFLKEAVAGNKLLEQCQVTIDCPNIIISADGHRLHQVMDNLFDNAILHGQCTQMTIRVWQEAGTIIFEVIDNGAGMSKEQRLRAFDRYVTSGGKDSIGLGLSIAQEIIRQHNGTIELESEAGKGTCVRIILPEQVED